jgi:hypothetical protein
MPKVIAIILLAFVLGCGREIDVGPQTKSPKARPPADRCRMLVTHEECEDPHMGCVWLYTGTGCYGDVKDVGCFSIASSTCQADDECPNETTCSSYARPNCVYDPPWYDSICTYACGPEPRRTCLGPSELSLVEPFPEDGTAVGGSSP